MANNSSDRRCLVESFFPVDFNVDELYTDERRKSKKSSKKLKTQIVCDRSCLKLTEDIIKYCINTYGKVEYPYGNKRNIRHGLTIHHIVPKICGGGNEQHNLVYMPKDMHDSLHDIIGEKYCSAVHTVN